MYGNTAFSSGIQQTAQSLGMDPVDLATIISYETAGTFSPTQRGPTTQWGQHRGLIQFGEPQARQYGVNWDDPMNSQLGEDGAVARYFRGNGWQPGMGLLDAYSIVNAGGPGLYNRSDANNGGAPGTVADKVNEQMGGHRANAIRLLGQTGQSAPENGVNATMSTRNANPMNPAAAPPVEEGRESIWKRMGVFKDDDRREKLAMALAGMTLNPNEGLIRGLDASISARAKGRAETKARQEQSAQRNQTAEWLRVNGSADLAEAVQGNMIDGAGAYNAHLQRQQGVAGPEMPSAVVEAQWRAEEAGLQPGTPEYREFILSGEIQGVDTGYAIVSSEEAIRMGLPSDRVWQRGPDGEIKPVGGTPLVQNTIGAGESAFDEETGKILARESDSIAQAGALAQRNLGQIETLSALMGTSPQGLMGALTSKAGDFGIHLDGSSDLQALEALISQLIPAQRPPGSGVMSDADLEMFKRSLPRLINTPEGNAKIISTMRAITQYDVERGRIARRQQLGEITPSQAFSAYESLGNPIGDFLQGDGAPAPTGGFTPAPQSRQGSPNIDQMSDDDLLNLYMNGGQ